MSIIAVMRIHFMSVMRVLFLGLQLVKRSEVRDACQQRSVSALQHTRLISDVRRAEDRASPADRAELIKAEETKTRPRHHRDRDSAARFPSTTVCSAGGKLVRSLVWLTESKIVLSYFVLFPKVECRMDLTVFN